jgi:hypothetical protein
LVNLDNKERNSNSALTYYEYLSHLELRLYL